MLFKNLLALCKERGTTFAEVERETGLGKGTIRRWGDNAPSVDKVKTVADHFGVTVDYLLTDHEPTEVAEYAENET